ncbi:recombinase family protein [Alicyclobacillus sp. SO9]|uniref:recombinase family protein n=1 Tax=Alicyclobacillus sp. SO9 TaxID=2665646 RepID=UPI0018E7F874|nr:recombinase family protein [Alicyclobacillus sp. SO9]QQE79597.1 recombinase family protein [Alicyclobacillus sp. SO9]
MRKAVIYTRVSTDEQTRGFSLESQRERGINKADELGVTDTIVFEEAGVSGEVINRPALMDAIAASQRDESVKYFICSDPDRLSRDLTYLLLFTEQIEKGKRVELVFTDFNREDTAEGKLFYSIRGAIAEFEKAMIRRRTIGGKIKKAQQHKWTHWPDIYGYNYNEGVVTENEEEARTVRMIYEWGSNMGTASICGRLHALGISSPRGSRTWSRTTVKRILENKSYHTGKTFIRKYDTGGTHLNKYRADEDKLERKLRPRDEWVEMEIPPLVTEEAFQAVQRRSLVARRRATSNINGRFLLSGLLRCGHCGKTWHGHSGWNHNKTKRRIYYVCTYKSPGPPKGQGLERCPTSFEPAPLIEEAVWNTVKGWILDDEQISAFHNAQLTRHKPSSHSAEREKLVERFNQINREEDALIERLARESNPRVRGKLNERLDKISAELDQIQTLLDELDSAESETAASEIDSEAISWIRENLPDPEQMSFEQKYEVIHRLITEIVIQQQGDELQLDIRTLRPMPPKG